MNKKLYTNSALPCHLNITSLHVIWILLKVNKLSVSSDLIRAYLVFISNNDLQQIAPYRLFFIIQGIHSFNSSLHWDIIQTDYFLRKMYQAKL